VEKILVTGCKKTMNDICIGCNRCTIAFNRKDGEFSRYKSEDARFLGILNCEDCPGAAVGMKAQSVQALECTYGRDADKNPLWKLPGYQLPLP
jgi:predicted metal-binding protein